MASQTHWYWTFSWVVSDRKLFTLWINIWYLKTVLDRVFLGWHQSFKVIINLSFLLLELDVKFRRWMSCAPLLCVPLVGETVSGQTKVCLTAYGYGPKYRSQHIRTDAHYQYGHTHHQWHGTWKGPEQLLAVIDYEYGEYVVFLAGSIMVKVREIVFYFILWN